MHYLDLRAAFDKVDRKELWNTMEKGGVEESLMDRILKIYEETISMVRVNGKEVGSIWIERGVRQGCKIICDNI